ncbi:hypothetical protein HHJ78_02495 [Mobiluncus mulieris]|uniref:Terminase small subunit n=1 Tax=Mobiluncus mulieris TaxID=2052 RepID=A0A7Y0TZZ3_9ACTO|nr:hypothetical protein [Mobiluncus mulieris]NMW64424.1 hypothetical protein [Mobiluncus mulieris]NMX11170.1 hypothetical protein [Mobiluncus mulieris]
MGTRGPVGKRSEDRLRRNKKEGLTVVKIDGAAAQQPEAPSYWHPTARRIWDSIAVSGQARFYEASDWAYAWMMMDLVTQYMTMEKPNGQLIGAILSGLTSLCLTEGDRRRVGIELTREAGEDDKTLAAAVEWQKRLA